MIAGNPGEQERTRVMALHRPAWTAAIPVRAGNGSMHSDASRTSDVMHQAEPVCGGLYLALVHRPLDYAAS
jgi:hypothetical protein